MLKFVDLKATYFNGYRLCSAQRNLTRCTTSAKLSNAAQNKLILLANSENANKIKAKTGAFDNS